MATIALAAVAASVTSGLGAVTAAVITTGLTLAGGILDNAFVFPAIFGRPDVGTIEGPRLSTLAPQDGSEGVPLNFCVGSRVRVGGNVIWVTDLEEVTVTGGGGGGGKGGGGGGGGQTRTYEYYVSAMIAICEGPIEGICKVYADGKTFVVNESPGTLNTTTTVEVTATLQLLANLPFSYYGPMQLYNASGGGSYWSDLDFQGTGEVTISGFSDSDNNGTFEVKNKRVRNDGNESLTLRYASYPPVVNSNESASVTVSQTVDRFPSNVDRVAFYAGGAADAIDSLYEGAVDAELGGTPRYKGVAKMVVERLALADYGNRLPQFNFVVNMQDPTTVREAIAAIMERGGFTSGDYDVSGIDVSYELEGYSVSGAKSIAAMLEPIMLVWNLAVYENNGVLTFYERGDETTVSQVRDKDWTARPHGSGSEDIATIGETPTFDLPSEVSISYFDSSDKDAAAEVKARRIDTVSDIVQAIRIPVWMDAGRARVVAENRLWRAWNDRYRANFNLPPRYLQLTEGDIVPIEIAGETFNVRLTRISRGANWLLACEGIVQSNDDFDFTADGDTQDADDDGTVVPPGNLLLFIFNAAALSDDHISTPGYYWAFAMENSASEFNGGSLYAATSEAGTYSLVNSSGESIIVATEDQLPDVTNPNIFDEINTIDVDAINGTLSSVSEQDLLAGANRLVMSNGEIIGFQTATTIGTNRYRLSKLLRGRRNTEQYTGTHSADGEIGVVVDATLNFESINLAAINTTEYFKPVAVGQAVDDIPAEPFTYLACTIKPFSVANIEATRDGSNNVTLTWDRRSRANYPELVATIPPPLVDGMEEYEIDLYDPTDTDVENTYSTTSPTVDISDADILAAGYSSGDPINVRVYQISPTIGRGTEKEATV